MTDINETNAAFYWSSLFFQRLRQLQIKHVVISPGSRSTPLTLAAAANDHFHKHVILDERSAAFTALGIGKSTNLPAVVICTSGTALANYYPAVIEARKSGVPMILATADRPPHLRATGANQTMDQINLFGNYPVFFHEVGEPVLKDKDLVRMRTIADQAVTASREQRGPVHLNFPFRKPLEPEPEFLRETATENSSQQLNTDNSALFSYDDSLHLPDEIVDIISRAGKPLVIMGPTAPDDDTGSVAALGAKLECPVISESTVESEHAITGFEAFLHQSPIHKKLSPDLILRFGFQPTSKGIEKALNQWQPQHHIHFASSQAWHDATHSVTRRISWLGRDISLSDFSVSTQNGWMEQWRDAEKEYQNQCKRAFQNTEALTDGHVYRHLTPKISTDQFIAVSNSFPARDIHLFGKHIQNIPLFLNRGVSGIDGVTSTAIGVGIGLNRPGVLFTGDLAFLHDSNALLSHKLLNQPLVIVVINNSGGSIFRMLPIEQHDDYFRKYFETPQDADFAQLAGSHDIPYYLADSVETLQEIDLHTLWDKHRSLCIVECKTDPAASMRLRRQLWKAD